MGSIRDATGSFSIGLVSIATGALVGGVVLVAFGRDRRLGQAPDAKEEAYRAAG
jgi:MFS transporter, ACS family, tartrate transporter